MSIFFLAVLAAALVVAPAGAQIADAGCDFDRDGRADLVVGIPRADVEGVTQAGRVEILRGNAQGVSTTPLDGIDEEVPGVIGAAETWDRFGSVVACGDFDGDGDADLAVGSPFENRFGKADGGQVAIFYGDGSGVATTGEQLVTQDSTGVAGAVNKFDRFGTTLAVGDFDGDGFDDLAVGVPLEDVAGQTNAGAVNVFYGRAGGFDFGAGDQYWHEQRSDIIGVPLPSDFFGAALAAADFDGDGRDDLAIGVPGATVNGQADAGEVSVIYGRVGGLKGSTNQLFNLETPGFAGVAKLGDVFGTSLTTGDFDGDGYADLIVGAPGKDVTGRESAGMVFEIPGSANGLKGKKAVRWSQDTGLDDGPDPYDRFGEAVAAGDFDDDGFDDLAVGVPNEWSGASPQEGAVAVILGGATGLKSSGDEIWRIDAIGFTGRAGDGFGANLTAADFDGDGRVDLAVGVPNAVVQNDPAAGAVVILDGSTTSGLASSGQQYITRNGLSGGVAAAYERFGGAVAAS